MVDFTFLEKFTKGDKNKMKRYISMYLESTPDSFIEMAICLKNEDWEGIKNKAHSLKPQTEFIGAIALNRILIKIEDAVKSNHYKLLSDLIEQATELNSAAEITLKEKLNTL